MSNIKVIFTRSKIIITCERSCHKEYMCNMKGLSVLVWKFWPRLKVEAFVHTHTPTGTLTLGLAYDISSPEIRPGLLKINLHVHNVCDFCLISLFLYLYISFNSILFLSQLLYCEYEGKCIISYSISYIKIVTTVRLNLFLITGTIPVPQQVSTQPLFNDTTVFCLKPFHLVTVFLLCTKYCTVHSFQTSQFQNQNLYVDSWSSSVQIWKWQKSIWSTVYIALIW